MNSDNESYRARPHTTPTSWPTFPSSSSTPSTSDGEPASLMDRMVNLLGVILPFLGLVAAGYLLWGGVFGWLPLGLLMGMYLLTGLGITVGFHRLFTHRSFETNMWVQFVLGVLGSMAVEAPLIEWVAQHRHHHQKSDKPGDPHSPHLDGHGVVGLFRGLWHAHVGWFINRGQTNMASYVPDLLSSGVLRKVSRLFPLWAALGLVIPTVMGWALSGTWLGAMLGFLWGGLVRIFFVHHVTWSINSICHLWGSQPFRTGDRSKNNFVFGLLAMGEGWHNNHHAFPASARHGLWWWQFDLSYLVIRLMELVGLAWNVKVPAPQYVITRKR